MLKEWFRSQSIESNCGRSLVRNDVEPLSWKTCKFLLDNQNWMNDKPLEISAQYTHVCVWWVSPDSDFKGLKSDESKESKKWKDVRTLTQPFERQEKREAVFGQVFQCRVWTSWELDFCFWPGVPTLKKIKQAFERSFFRSNARENFWQIFRARNLSL